MDFEVISGDGDLSARYVTASDHQKHTHTHEEFQVMIPLLADSASVYYETNGGSLRSKLHGAGDVHLVDVGQPHSLQWNYCEMIMLFISPETMQTVADDVIGGSVSTSDWYGIDDRAISSLGMAMRDHVTEFGSFSRIFRESICLVAAGRLVERLARRSSSKATPSIPDRRIRAVCEYVESYLGGDLSVSALAAIAGLSPFHFLRTFRDATSATPHAYILERRLARARDRLAVTKDSVLTIATELGFANASHLALAFRRRFGVTPHVYRRSYGGT